MSISKITIAESGLIDRYRIRYRVADLAPVDPSWRLRPAHVHVRAANHPL